jgi:hypothetical protein
MMGFRQFEVRKMHRAPANGYSRHGGFIASAAAQ